MLVDVQPTCTELRYYYVSGSKTTVREFADDSSLPALPSSLHMPAPPTHEAPPCASMESLPAELLAHILRFVPTERGEAYRSGAGWVACELAGYEDPPPTALPVTATWRQDEGAQVTLAGDGDGGGGGGSGGGGGGGMAAEGHAGLRELAALTCTSRALRDTLSPDIVWAPFQSRLEGRFQHFQEDHEGLWIPAHAGLPVEYYAPGRPQTRAARQGGYCERALDRR